MSCIMVSAEATSWPTHALNPTTRWLQFRDVPRLKSRRVAREMLLNAAMLPHVSPATTTSYKEHGSLVLCLVDRVRVWVSSTCISLGGAKGERGSTHCDMSLPSHAKMYRDSPVQRRENECRIPEQSAQLRFHPFRLRLTRVKSVAIPGYQHCSWDYGCIPTAFAARGPLILRLDSRHCREIKLETKRRFKHVAAVSMIE